MPISDRSFSFALKSLVAASTNSGNTSDTATHSAAAPVTIGALQKNARLGSIVPRILPPPESLSRGSIDLTLPPVTNLLSGLNKTTRTGAHWHGQFPLTPQANPPSTALENKQDKQAVIAKVRDQGHQTDNVLVTRRPQDLMFSQAAYTQSGFCQGFVLSAFKNNTVFNPSLTQDQMAQDALTAQDEYAAAFNHRDRDAKTSLYQSNGFRLSSGVSQKNPAELVSYLASRADAALGDQHSNSTLYFDIHLSGGGRTDHAVGIAIERQENGKFNAAVIDADRGIRRTLGKPDLTEFFADLSKQSDGSKTKSGANRKFHSWQNRHFEIKEVKVKEVKGTAPQA